MFILSGLAKVVSWLLFKLGLWVPVAFTLLFFIALAVTGTPFSELSGVYVFGLIATCIFSIVSSILLTVGKIENKLDKKIGRGGTQKVSKKSKKKAELVEDRSDDKPSFVGGHVEAAPLFPTPEPEPDPQRTEPVRQPAPDTSEAYDDESKNGGVTFLPYNSVVEPDRRTDRTFLPYDRPAGANAGNMRISADSDEQPRIFRTRMDKNLLIYEYSDRLDYYMRTPTGYVLVSSERKR